MNREPNTEAREHRIVAIWAPRSWLTPFPDRLLTVGMLSWTPWRRLFFCKPANGWWLP